MPGAQKEGPAPCAIPAQSTAASANQVRITSSYCNPPYKTSFTSTSNIFFPRNPPTINYLKKLPQPRPPKSLYPLGKIESSEVLPEGPAENCATRSPFFSIYFV